MKPKPIGYLVPQIITMMCRNEAPCASLTSDLHKQLGAMMVYKTKTAARAALGRNVRLIPLFKSNVPHTYNLGAVE